MPIGAKTVIFFAKSEFLDYKAFWAHPKPTCIYGGGGAGARNIPTWHSGQSVGIRLPLGRPGTGPALLFERLLLSGGGRALGGHTRLWLRPRGVGSPMVADCYGGSLSARTSVRTQLPPLVRRLRLCR